MVIAKVFKQINCYLEGCITQPSLQYQHLSGAGANYLLVKKLQDFSGKKYVVLFCNATTALQAVCLAMDLQDAEIITAPINWGGSISPFLLHRCNLRFSSFDTASLNIDLRNLPAAITHKTKAVLAVDYNGTSTDSKAIESFCRNHGLKYISDGAQSFGAFRNNKPAGFFADANILSFSPGKSFFAGEGGAVLTDDVNLFEKLIWYSQHPSMQKTIFGISYYNEYAPLNGRMNPLSAILLNETFESSLKALERYQEKCFQFFLQLQKEDLVESNPQITSREHSTFFNFCVQLKPLVGIQQLNDYLKHQEQPFMAIQSLIKLIPFDASFKKQFRGKFSCSESLLKQKPGFKFSDRVTLVSSQLNIEV